MSFGWRVKIYIKLLVERILVGIFSLLVLGVGVSTASANECSYLTGLEDEKRIRCGVVTSPENHDRPTGRKIEIAYVVVGAKNDKTHAHPLIFFSGGPGGATISSGFARFFLNSEITNQRDVILFDQRGIGRSSPLPDIGLEVYKAMAADTDLKGEGRLIGAALRKYQKLIASKGIGLANYNSIQNARDVAVLMKTLGYKKYNLIGVSYGTRLARLIQDMFPGLVDSVILDSPNLMTDDFLIDRIKGYSAAAEKVFRFCEKDRDCVARLFSNLRRVYNSTIMRLKRKPIVVSVEGEKFYVNAQDAVYFLRRQLYRADAKKTFPEFVFALRDEDLKKIRAAVESERQLISGGGF